MVMGSSNIQDIILIAASFGESGESNADLNGDGEVNVQDLVIIGNAFGNAAGAPSAHGLSAVQVEQWLRLAKRDASQHIQTTASDIVSYQPRHSGARANFGIADTANHSTACQLSEPVQSRNMDTLSVSNACRGRIDDLCNQRTSRPNLDLRTSTCGDVSESQPCCLLGRQKRTRRTRCKRNLFLHVNSRRFHRHAKDVNTEIVSNDLMIAGRFMFIDFPAIIAEWIVLDSLP